MSQSYFEIKKQSGETPLSLADKRVKIIVFPRNLSASLFPSVPHGCTSLPCQIQNPRTKINHNQQFLCVAAAVVIGLELPETTFRSPGAASCFVTVSLCWIGARIGPAIITF